MQLIVSDQPFLILGGELGNSSASHTPYLQPVWPKLKQMHLNTVIAPVYWELIEAEEGKFNFNLVDDLIRDARKNQMKLVLLWFGAWKNSMSCYAPAWVKTDTKRFPRAEDRKGKKQEILSPFSKANLEADQQAFAALMRHLKQTDGLEHTVIMIQVENEIGMLPEARTYDAAANTAFKQDVPAKLFTYLQENKNSLLPEIKRIWKEGGYKTHGSWEEVFGKSLATDEIFMAWYYARFIDELTLAGKKAYNLPMYVNAALNAPGKKPGDYPSAGPLPHVMDIWKAAAPSVDILAPDFYNPDFRHWSDLYTRASDPLFIPEIRFEAGVDAKAFFAFGNYNCLSFSPFSIESTDQPEKEPIGKAYAILHQLIPLLTQYGPAGQVKGFMLDKDSASTTLVLGNYKLHISHDYKLGWSPESKKDSWPLTGGLVVATGPGEFYVSGTGVVITFESLEQDKRAGFLSIDEGKFENKQWLPGRRMNGDQDHQGRHVRIPVNDYGIQHVKMYSY